MGLDCFREAGETIPSVVLVLVVVVGYHEGVGFYTSRNDERLPVLDFLRRTSEAGDGTGGGGGGGDMAEKKIC